MNEITAKNAARQNFLPLVRELVRAYQAFAALDAAGYREAGSGLTVAQADVIFTLGNTDGMTTGEIGDKTLITKGTLTGVLDRLQEKGLIRRQTCPKDARCTRIHLTAKGEKLFETEFPRQVTWLKSRFDRLSEQDLKRMQKALADLRKLLDHPS